MAGFARRTGIAVEVATFEAWESAGRDFDAVVAGQAWHWVDPVAGAAKAARVLRPGGRLALFWHVNQPPPELMRAFAEAYHRVVRDGPFNFQAMAKQPLDRTAAVFTTRAADGIQETGGARRHRLSSHRSDPVKLGDRVGRQFERGTGDVLAQVR
jgi:SAM-dependent methyltransferase